MRTFPVIGDDGIQRAFEIEHVYISRGALFQLLSSIEGVSCVTKPDRKERTAGVRVEFKHRDVDFFVWEPYGDNSRYWIGPKENLILRDPSQLREIEEAFDRYRAPLLLKILGDLVSLNFKGLFRAE
jgi:hypothetical protein